MRTPKDDPDTRPLVDRCQADKQLAQDLYDWVVPICSAVEDSDLRARCLLLLGMACARITRPEGRR